MSGVMTGVTFPTTGAVVGDHFYFMASTGIANLQNGRIIDKGLPLFSNVPG